MHMLLIGLTLLSLAGVAFGMAWEAIQRNLSAPAGIDLSGKQFYCVRIDGSGNLQLANANKNIDGVLQDKPILAQAGNYCIDGVTKAAITANQTIGISGLLMSDTGGTMTAWTTGNTAIGRALEAGTSTGIFILTVQLLRSNAVYH